MILVDTSIWVEHLRKGMPGLIAALERNDVLTHPFVMGELACGNLKNRQEVLRLLGDLPIAPVATDPEVPGVHRATLADGPGHRLHRCASARFGDAGRRRAALDA